MKKRFIGASLIALASIGLLAACKGEDEEIKNGNDIDTTKYIFSDEYDEYDNVDESFSIELANPGVGNFTRDGNTYVITEGGEYNLSGVLPDGNIIINSTDTVNDVVLNLNGCTITSKSNSPILVKASETDVDISAKNGTENLIIDRRTEIDESNEEQGLAAIYSTVDLTLKGKGNLNVVGAVNNGIQSKDDLKIKNQNLNVKAVNNAIKGNDSVTIENLNATIISVAGDGIKTTNSDISDKGNQRGTVTIKGASQLDIYACCDGIDAAYNTDILADDSLNEPTLNIYTSTYSNYSADIAASENISTNMYLRLSNSYYNSSYSYYAYCYNFDDNNQKVGEWVKFNYMTQAGRGPNQSYSYLNGAINSSKYKNIQFYIFQTDNPNENSYYAATTGQTINATKDMFIVSSITASSQKIGGDWSNYSSQNQAQMGGGPGGMMDEGNKDKTEYSTKGIKVDNEINISAGNIKIEAYDDGLHANSNIELENSSLSTGNINVSAGSLTITSKDDGIHGEGTVELSGGKISVLTSYEGVEGHKINFSGSVVDVYATDDGINAGGTGATINVSGGFVYSSVGQGDTDAIDSNGTYNQTGGIVISVAGSTSGTATALDTDSNVYVKGGALLCLGSIEKTPSTSNVYSYSIPQMTSGEYSFSKDGEAYTFNLNNSFSQSSIRFYGSSGSYIILKNNSTFTSFNI